MLKMFRDNLKYLSWIIWVVIAVFILFVFVDFGSIQLGGTAPTDAAASVGDQAVTYGEFERTYRQTEDYYRQTLGDQFNRELAQQMGLPLQVLDQLVAEKIVLGEADRWSLRRRTALPGDSAFQRLYRRAVRRWGTLRPSQPEGALRARRESLCL
jgi:hypothetical protein